MKEDEKNLLFCYNFDSEIFQIILRIIFYIISGDLSENINY